MMTRRLRPPRRMVVPIGIGLSWAGMRPAAVAADDLYANPFVTAYPKFAIAALVLIFIIFVLIYVLQRSGALKKSETSVSMMMSDLTKMEQKGLLTPEEARKVREVLAKQTMKRLAEQSARPPSGAEALLVDPEVSRLTALAAEKQKKRDLPMLVSAQEVNSRGASPTRPAEAVSASQSPNAPAAVSPTEDHVALPPDIEDLAARGLLTSEEVARIKERIRQQQNQRGTE